MQSLMVGREKIVTEQHAKFDGRMWKKLVLNSMQSLMVGREK